jgi:hypothetical protein
MHSEGIAFHLSHVAAELPHKSARNNSEAMLHIIGKAVRNISENDPPKH